MKRQRTTQEVMDIVRGKKTKSKSAAQKSIVTKSRDKVIPKFGFPLRFYVAHRYTEQVTITSSAGAVAGYAFKCNGMFDPNTTGTGHQPQYFDICSSMYNHYTVLKSSCKFTLTPTVALTNPTRCAICIDDDGTLPATINAVAEAGTGKTFDFAVGNSSPRSSTLYWNAQKYFGGSVLGNDNLQGTGSTDPGELSSFALLLQAPAGVTQSYFLTVDIVFYAVWEELKNLAEN